MRVASMMMTNNYLKQLNGTYEQYTKIMEQSDGDKLHRASDDCVGYSKYLRYQNNLIGNEQFSANVKTATSWMKNSDAALVNVTDLMHTFKVKVEQAGNSPNNESDMKDIAKELLANVQEQVSDLNTQIGDRYLFSGQSDTTCPFQISDEKKSRGETKTLDDAQAAFFSGISGTSSSSSVKQMLKLNGDDGNTYYMNVKTGDIYTEDFVENGYKNEASLASYLQNNTVANINAGYRNTGNTYDVSTVASTFGGVKMLEEFTAGGNTYYANTETGDVYNAAAVQAYVANPTTAPVPAAQANIQFNVGANFDKNGAIVDNVAGQGVNWTDNTAVTGVKLTLATCQQYIVTYKGDEKYISMVKKTGGVDQATDTVNVTGQDLFGTDIFDDGQSPASGTAMLNELLYAVSKIDAADYKWAGKDGLTISDTAHSSVLGAETKMAARQQAYTAASGMLTTQNESITSDIADVHSTDVAALATKLMEYQTIYSLSLSVGSKILPGTLADYLS